MAWGAKRGALTVWMWVWVYGESCGVRSPACRAASEWALLQRTPACAFML